VAMQGHDAVDTRIPGIALTTSALLAVFAMAHHPTAGGEDFMAFARNVERTAVLNQAVHGVLIALVAVITWGLVVFALRRGVGSPLVTLGLVAWAIGVAGMTIAPIFNGFVIVDVARRALAEPETSELLRAAFLTISAAVGVVAVIGALGMSAAMVFWSADLARSAGAVRWVGGLGLAAGAILVLALLTGIVRLNLGGMTLVLAVWSAWFVAVGALMILRKV
jgi:hypothetical protein